jgi:3-oxoacyl-[acyl-carrier-protein] synthase II
LELSGGAFGSDAYHLTDLDPDPRHLAGLIGRGLEDSRVGPDEIDLIHPHATATVANDRLEARALRQVFGRSLEGAVCWASKPQIGHLLGASGASELVLTCLALRDGLVPPTLNREEPDPELALPFVSGQARTRAVRSALKLAIGFGGHLAAVVVRRRG